MDGRMEVKFDARFFPQFRLGSKGEIDFSNSFQTQEVKIFLHFNVIHHHRHHYHKTKYQIRGFTTRSILFSDEKVCIFVRLLQQQKLIPHN
jgi:hypothetical protein